MSVLGVLIACATSSRPVVTDEEADLLEENPAELMPSCFDGGVCRTELPLANGVSCQVQAVAYDSGACLVEVERRPPSVMERGPRREVIECGQRQPICERPFLCDCSVTLPEQPCGEDVYARRFTRESDAGERCTVTVTPPVAGSCEVVVERQTTNATAREAQGWTRLGSEQRVCGVPLACRCPFFQKPDAGTPPDAGS